MTGTCDDGADGTGACTCPPGRFGATCFGACDCVNGTCSDGAAGTGACTCTTGWTGVRCDACAPGFFGPSCTPCPSCAPNEACDDGISGTGACECVPTSLIDDDCDNVDDDCDGPRDEDFEPFDFGCCLGCPGGVYQEFQTEYRCFAGDVRCVPKAGASCNIGAECF